ncbi:DNA polymerase III subunit chi [Shinella daejeonensis]|uniref:DNA polymerase III subunit chi n=1 Tax=Shinella daejeonensis TaxID=659017 RepID=UPI0020C7FE56|nr:DNA polymerase III subunit chi [Shinella daejeonensis]
MSEVLFYHLTESKLEDALPPLLDKSLERGWRVVVQTGDTAQRDALDTHLWTYRDDSFLPHGTDEQAFPAEQPILLTATPDNLNAATVRFLVYGAEPPALDAYERVIFMFDGYDQAEVEAAREHWKRLKTGGHQLTYWQQDSDRRWTKKA